MSKRPTDGLEPEAKKRGSSRQLTKDDASDEEEDRGSLQTATAEVMKARKIVKARRGTGAPPSTPTGGVPKALASSNPFAGVSILGKLEGTVDGGSFAALAAKAASSEPTTLAGKEAEAAAPAPAENPEAAEKPADGSADAVAGVSGTATPEAAAEAAPVAEAESHKPAAEDGKAEGEKASTPGEPVAPAFATFASKAPFSWAGASAGTGFGFGSLANGADNSKTNGALAGKDESSKPGPFNFGTTAPAFSFTPLQGGFPAVASIFGSSNNQSGGEAEAATGQQDDVKPALAALPPETQTVTGEEEEDTRWSGEGSLYEFSAERAWKERGKGELKINQAPGRPARFVMRQRGNHRLLMNANLWAEMKVTPMDGGKGATFPVVNSAQGSDVKLQTFAFRLKAAGELDHFIEAINIHKTIQTEAMLNEEVQDEH